MPTSLPEYESTTIFSDKLDFAAWPSSYNRPTRRIDLAQLYTDTLIAAQQHRQREKSQLEKPPLCISTDAHQREQTHSEPPSPTESTACLLPESKSSPSKFSFKLPTWKLPKKGR